jgi:hypothetical protein
MPVDFSKLVLTPCMEVFARVMTVDPVTSRPGALPYQARAIFTSVDMPVLSMDGVELSDVRTFVGIRVAEFTGPPPAARDKLTMDGVDYTIEDVTPDGQGGAKLRLRRIEPDFPE